MKLRKRAQRAEARIAAAMKVLDPNMPEQGIEGAARQVKAGCDQCGWQLRNVRSADRRKGSDQRASPGVIPEPLSPDQGLKWVRKFVEYARYELEPGEPRVGDQFPRQCAADKAMAEIDLVSAALTALEAQIATLTTERDAARRLVHASMDVYHIEQLRKRAERAEAQIADSSPSRTQLDPMRLPDDRA